MSENEIVLELRQLAKDLGKHGLCELTKIESIRLLSGTSKGGGGVLNQWWNREMDERRKIALLSIIKIVVNTYQGKVADVQAASEQLSAWCDEIGEAMDGEPTSDPWVKVPNEDCNCDRSTLHKHAKDSSKDFIRKGTRGFYEIRASQLYRYMTPGMMEKFLPRK